MRPGKAKFNPDPPGSPSPVRSPKTVPPIDPVAFGRLAETAGFDIDRNMIAYPTLAATRRVFARLPGAARRRYTTRASPPRRRGGDRGEA